MLEEPPPSASSLGDSIKLYPTVYKAGSRNLCSSTARRKYWHLISNAEAFDNLEPGQQAEHLCHALFEDFGVLKTRLIAAESAVTALQVEVATLKRSLTQPKRKVG